MKRHQEKHNLKETTQTSHWDSNVDEIGDTNNNISNKNRPTKLGPTMRSFNPTSEIIHEAEEWQLLEAEETTYDSKSVKDKGHEMMKRKSNAMPRMEKSRSDYIELDPIGSARYSPILSHLCTAIYSLIPIGAILATFGLIALLFTRYFYLTLIYLAYVHLDRGTCNRGGRRIGFVYNSIFWSYLAAYFPIRLRYPPEFRLDPKANYILNYSPHGISAFGAVAFLATNGLKLTKLFPGIYSRFIVHETSFIVPLLKETFSLRGDCSVNSKSIDYLLSQKDKKGNLLTIVAGGLAEADMSNPTVLKIVLRERKGWIKKALIHGAHIVPCIAFGENSVFTKINTCQSSLIHKIEKKWYQLFRFKHPLYFGRSIISSNYTGVMPYKKPITIVMGDPIPVEQFEAPSQEDIDALHSKYIEKLEAMYKANSDLCNEYDKVLEIC